MYASMPRTALLRILESMGNEPPAVLEVCIFMVYS
ncbi:hypothetical protein TRIP_B350187 [uncultured Desulfatiglans sp.]|nr:hypothetical protein TRIP_B350187 [uncultured Desulfatiglans sp.]